MKKILSISIIAAFVFLFVKPIYAEIKLPAIVSSNMVLQRNTTVLLWGWADNNEKIAIETSWMKEVINIKADDTGAWQTEVKTTDSKAAQTIKLKDKTSTITLDNILFGEVWLCSGQSNMQQPINGYNGQPTYGTNQAVAHSNNPNLRLFSVDRAGSKVPLNDIEKYSGWEQASQANVLEFSAIAYYFGMELQEILDVPVGMIHTSWGGSSVEAWISKEMMDNFVPINLDAMDITKNTNHIPTALYNSMIHPLIHFTIKGALWYQGESNRQQSAEYKALFPAMVEDWRKKWGIGDFPFYYVQIAPFLYGDNSAFSVKDNSAFMREAQLQCLDLIPNSGIAITMDLGEANYIHPPKKKEVADRLLWNALHQTYGFKNVDGAAPIFESQEIEDGRITLKFKNAETGLYAFGDLEGFEIAGENKVFYPAAAKIIRGNTVLVSSIDVPKPVAVRYGWRNWTIGTLYDANILPASSFRTDNWEDATHVEK